VGSGKARGKRVSGSGGATYTEDGVARDMQIIHSRLPALVLAVALALGLVAGAFAAGPDTLAGAGWAGQARRFLSLEDGAVRYALGGAVLLGLSCGLLGSFIVVRRMALVGDALSHAVLPGVALGFLWSMDKDPLAIFVGAVIAGLLGTGLVSAITRTTRLKEDTALGLVLASFFAVGLCLVTMIQRLPTGNKSGIDKFLFGQAAALGPEDLVLMGAVTAAAVLLVIVFYKELLVTSFDAAFARASGLPASWVHHGLMFLLAATVVISLQAVGVVLVSAMLITPAATAYLLTDRLHRMIVLAAAIGIGAGIAGTFLSFVGPGLPTGPLMVVSASVLFAGAFLFAPRQGVVTRWWLRRAGVARTRRENALKSMFHVGEAEGFRAEGVTLDDLARHRRETREEVDRLGRELVRHELATVAGDVIYFTPAGLRRAREIVRNHRLWELYLTQSANFAPDHVHDDAERVEHVLGEAVVRDLERRLAYARTDPHGRVIPSPRDPAGPGGERGAGGGGAS
jgi:ABC-type Mn2+/Zn2+ transport system permease subunit/Mn-dependent DtxR family transcriptional regulator